MHTRRSTWTVIALCALLLLAAGCGSGKEYQQHTVAEVCEAAEWGDYVQVSGELTPDCSSQRRPPAYQNQACRATKPGHQTGGTWHPGTFPPILNGWHLV